MMADQSLEYLLIVEQEKASRRLALLKRYDTRANECPECGAKREIRWISVDEIHMKEESYLPHAAGCELAEEIK